MAAKIPGVGGVAGLLGELLGNETMRSIVMWQVFGDIMQATLEPFTTALRQDLFAKTPDVALGVAEAATAVIKGHKSFDDAAKEAAQWGVSRDHFQTLVDVAGEPPGPETLLLLWRRKVIPEKGAGPGEVSVEQGIREGRIKNKWIEPLKALKTALPSPEMALQALLEGQTDRANAQDLYEQWGGDPRFFQLMFDTRGSAPTPLEAAEMARRNIIPWDGDGAGVVSFRQAFLEGPWRNKWLDPYRALSEYLPPPRTVTALVREGALTDAQAAVIYQKTGLSKEMAAVYITAAHHQKTAATRELTKSDVLTAYQDRLIPHDQALKLLVKLGWQAVDAEFELAVADFRRDHALINGAINKIKSLFIARKIDEAAATTALGALGLTADHMSGLFAVWRIERLNQVQRLTAAEWAEAAYYQLITPAEAIAALTALGFTPYEAWVRVGIRLHGKIDVPEPAKDIPPAYTAK